MDDLGVNLLEGHRFDNLLFLFAAHIVEMVILDGIWIDLFSTAQVFRAL